MKKTLIIPVLIVLSIAVTVQGRGAYSPTGTVEGVNQGRALLAAQIGWVILDETTSTGTEPSDLAVTERTHALIQAAITAAASGDDEISVVHLPASWNEIRLRAAGITDDGTATYQIYLGTLAGGADCDLAYAGQCAFTIGTQSSIYSQIAYTSGGTATIDIGDTLTGATSGETAVVISITVTSGTFAAGTAAGTITVRTQSGTFQAEELNVTDAATGVVTINNATIAADMTRFELADTLTLTQSDWTVTPVTKSPTGNRVAETRIPLNGADLLVAVPTVMSADGKLLGKGK